ncbi:hypothetical protein LL946_16050 [Knoellia locipacati]|uniref:hypothetical protein n=1 Tax=Knoellia locipacati TaxID=882824 RepID=UPI00384CE3F8
MSWVRWLEVVGWVVFWAGILTMFARLALRRTSVRDKYRTGWILALTMIVSSPLLAIVYTLGALDVVDTLFSGSGRRGPGFMAVTAIVMTVLAPGALRRTRRGLAETSGS